MKKITLFLFALFTCWQINAQVSSYAFSTGTTGVMEPMTGSTQLLGSNNSLNVFLNPNTSPNPGEIYLYWDSGSYNTTVINTGGGGSVPGGGGGGIL